jgi:secreted trypsin-like serine protease
VFSASAALLMTVACGGGSRPTAPASPIPDTPCQADTAAASPLRPIINGTACNATVSSVVMLRMRFDESGASALCSGTIITPRVVLTAAHCLAQNPLDVTVVRGGTSDIVSRSYVVHPGYRAERYPLDVALIKTDQGLGRAAVPLLISRAAVIGERALLAGWGKDQAGSVGTLRAGTAAVDFVGETYLTTRNNEQTGMLCSGDSGGPLLLSHNGSWMLAGVAYESIYTGANTPLCESGISVYAGTHTAEIASFLRAEAADALFR